MSFTQGIYAQDGSHRVTVVDDLSAGGSGGGLTDTQLRASPVPVNGTLTGITNVVHVDDNSSTLSVDDGGGSLTVDGTFFQATQPVSIASAVPVTDNSGSLTVDGSVTAVQAIGTNLHTVVDSGSVTVSGTVTASGPLTDTELRATAVPISGTVTATGPLTDTQLRATAVPVSGTVTASGPLTDTQLRATAVPVSGTVTASGPLTDTQLRASAVPVTLTSTTVTGTVAVTESGTWTVQPGNTANTTAWKVDASSVAVPITDNSGSLTVDAPVGTPVFVRLSDGASAITTLPVSLASAPSTAVTNAGTFAVQASGTVTANIAPTTSGGLTISSAIMAATTNATSVKGSAGQLYKVEAFNNSTTIGYLKIYNTSGTPTAGSGTPVIRLMVPASGGVATENTNGIAFSTGIGYTFTGAVADNDTTAVAATTFIVNLYYK